MPSMTRLISSFCKALSLGSFAVATAVGMTPVADAAVLITDVDTDAATWRGATGANVPTWTGSAGYKFTVGASDISVTHLGLFDGPGNGNTSFADGAVGDGLGQDAEVAIWKGGDNTAPVAVVTISAGGGTLENGFRYVDIPDVVLLANTNYFIMAGYGGGDDGNVFTRYRDDGTVTFNSDGVTITTGTAYYNAGGNYNDARYPSGTTTGLPHAGPNLKFIPEPASVALLGLGGLLMTTRGRRR